MASRNSARHQQYLFLRHLCPFTNQKMFPDLETCNVLCAGSRDRKWWGRYQEGWKMFLHHSTITLRHCDASREGPFHGAHEQGHEDQQGGRAKAIANQKIATTKKYIHQAIPIATPKATLARKSRANNKA